MSNALGSPVEMGGGVLNPNESQTKVERLVTWHRDGRPRFAIYRRLKHRGN